MCMLAQDPFPNHPVDDGCLHMAQHVQAELAERCSLLELKARMLEQSAGQLQYAEEGFADEQDDTQYANGILQPLSDDSL
jgi:hypothetical protein